MPFAHVQLLYTSLASALYCPPARTKSKLPPRQTAASQLPNLLLVQRRFGPLKVVQNVVHRKLRHVLLTHRTRSALDAFPLRPGAAATLSLPRVYGRVPRPFPSVPLAMPWSCGGFWLRFPSAGLAGLKIRQKTGILLLLIWFLVHCLLIFVFLFPFRQRFLAHDFPILIRD
jgi:hypothetical protein